MADLADVLDRTTPTDLQPLDRCDLADLARRSRRRNRTRRAALTTAAAVTAIALGAAAVIAVRSPDRPDGDGAVVWAGPGGAALEEPVGTWTRAADPAFSPRQDAFGGTLSDGRIVIWGGTSEAGAGLRDGGIYDPSTGDWETIPAAPLAGGRLHVVHGMQLRGDRLAVFGNEADFPVGASGVAVYDARGDAQGAGWLISPPLDLRLNDGDPLAMGWDGETFVLLVTDGQTEVWRWRMGSESWQRGISAPFALRTDAGTAFDGRRLAVWGGVTAGGIVADGAIYDVPSDTWDMIPTAPISGGRSPTVAWLNGQLAVSLSTIGAPLPREQFEDVGRVAIYDPTTDHWQTLPPPPEFIAGGGASYALSDGTASTAGGFMQWWPNPAASARFLVDTRTGDSWFLEYQHWERAPFATLFRLGTYTVAVGGLDSPYDCCTWNELGLQVQVGPNRWLNGADPPPGRRAGETVVASDDKLLVVGGSVRDDEPGSRPHLVDDAWVFDLAG